MASLPQLPQTPRHHISRDQRIIARTLRGQGYTYAQIAQQLHITQRQVQKACTDDRPTPRKAPGRSRKLSEEQLDEIIDLSLLRRKHNECLTRSLYKSYTLL
jgi:transposase